MTLIALLFLYPTPMVHTWGLDHANPRGQLHSRDVAPVIRDRTSVFFSGDPARGAGCGEEEWDEGDGAEALLGWPALLHLSREDDLPSSWPTLAVDISPSLRSRHLRC
jgi:hypothetical protein